jgi:hypothetical protein
LIVTVAEIVVSKNTEIFAIVRSRVSGASDRADVNNKYRGERMKKPANQKSKRLFIHAETIKRLQAVHEKQLREVAGGVYTGTCGTAHQSEYC